MKRTGISCMLFALILLLPGLSPGEDIYESQLDRGLKNNEPYTYYLIDKAQHSKAYAGALLSEARQHYPDLPQVYFELASFNFSLLPAGIFNGIDYTFQGIGAYKRNFWWSFNISRIFYLSILFSVAAAFIIMVVLRLPSEMPLLAHDVTEDRKKAGLLLLLIPLSFLGVLFFVAGALFFLGLYFRRADKAVVYIYFTILLLMPYLLHLTNLPSPSKLPELKAVVDVNEGKDNKYALAALKDARDFQTVFSYALALKREGYYERALELFGGLLESEANKLHYPAIYVNLGNCYYFTGDVEKAKEAYKKSINLRPLPSALYNLSQVLRETFDFKRGEEYFLEAVKLDSEFVSRATNISGKNPNRFIMDEPLSLSDIFDYSRNISHRLSDASFLNQGIASAVPAILIVLFYIFDKKAKTRAFRCKRCNTILCRGCVREFIWRQMCPQCYKSLVKAEDVELKDRITRIFSVYNHQNMRRNIIKLLSLTFPGAAQIYSGRIIEGMLYLWASLFLLFMLIPNPFSTAGLYRFYNGWLVVPVLVCFAILYGFSHNSMRKRINSGWA